MKLTKTITGVGLLLIAGLALGAATPARAQEWTVEGVFGYYDPDSFDENGEIYGARIGYRPSDHFGMLLSGGVIDLEDDILDIEDADLRLDLFLVDFSFQWYPTGNNFYLFGGPGFSTVDLEFDVPGNNNDINESDSTFTVHAGIGYRWDVGRSFFVRPEIRARWFDGDEFDAGNIDSYEGLDTEYSVGLGWKF